MKVKKGKLKDPESMAAMEIVSMEQKQEQLATLEIKRKEAAIAMTFEIAGKIKAMRFTEKQAKFFKLILLKRAKDEKSYRDQFNMTWEQFCDFCGENRRIVDEKLDKLKEFKSDFLESFSGFSDFDFNKIKYLGEAVSGGLLRISGNSIIYGDEEVPVVIDRADDVKALFEKIESDYKTKLEDTEANLRANKKIIKQKDDLLVKQEKDLRKFEKRAEGRGLSPEEDAFEQQIENFRIGFDGYMTRIEPTRIEELQSFAAPRREDGLHPPTTVTPRMRAMYLEVLGYMRRQIMVHYDTATEIFGADMEAPGEGWTPGGKS